MPKTTYTVRTDDGDVFDTTDAAEAERHALDGDRVTATTYADRDEWRNDAFDQLEHASEPYRDFGGRV